MWAGRPDTEHVWAGRPDTEHVWAGRPDTEHVVLLIYGVYDVYGLIVFSQCEQGDLTQSMSGLLTASSQLFEVLSVESQTEIDRRKQSMILTLSPTKVAPQNIQTPQDMEDDMANSGIVLKLINFRGGGGGGEYGQHT